MKNTYSILERNRIVEEHLWCIDSVMRKNHALIRTAHLDYEEVYQQLALRLIRAVETFDPDKRACCVSTFWHSSSMNCSAAKRPAGCTALPTRPQTSGAGSSSPLMHWICTIRMKHRQPRKEDRLYDTAR